MYTFTGRIRYSETDSREQLRPEAVIDYFQDCSSFQSEDRGVGFDFMRKHHVAWIVNYWQLDFLRLPSFGEEVRIGTSPYGFKGFIGLRNFLLETIEGEKLVLANSVWSLFDLEKGIPVRVLPEMAEAYELFPKFEMEYLPRKIRIPEIEAGTGSVSDSGKTGGSSDADKKDSGSASGDTGGCLRHEGALIPVTEDMLDSNGHVNNGQYVRIAMQIARRAMCQNVNAPELIPDVFHRLRVEYLSQAHLGDSIIPERYDTGKDSARSIVIALDSASTGKPYAVVELS